MEYAILNNGIKMPMAGIGTFLLSPDEAEAAVLHALEDGYRLIDTASAYLNEKAVGRAMQGSGLKREDIFLETKLWPSFYQQADAVDKTLADGWRTADIAKPGETVVGTRKMGQVIRDNI